MVTVKARCAGPTRSGADCWFRATANIAEPHDVDNRQISDALQMGPQNWNWNWAAKAPGPHTHVHVCACECLSVCVCVCKCRQIICYNVINMIYRRAHNKQPTADTSLAQAAHSACVRPCVHVLHVCVCVYLWCCLSWRWQRRLQLTAELQLWWPTDSFRAAGQHSAFCPKFIQMWQIFACGSASPLCVCVCVCPAID